MRKWVFLVGIASAAVVGCAFESTPPVDENDRQEAKLESSIGAWCDATCERLGECDGCACDGDVCDCVEIDEECPLDCRRELGEYLGHGEDCAGVGLEFMACVSGITCDELSDGDGCANRERRDDACGDRGDGGGPHPSPAPGARVSCEAGSGGGTAGGSGTAAFRCEETREECSDGARYHFVCSGTQESATCNCFRDGEHTGSFEVAPATCPSVPDVNASCGWNLVW